MKYCFFIFFLAMMNCVFAQSRFSGTYRGYYNNETIGLTLNHIRDNQLNGKLSDASSVYDVVAEFEGNRFAGDALNPGLGLKPVILGELKNGVLSIVLVFDIAGTRSEIKVDMQKVPDQKENGILSTTDVVIPKNATNDIKLVGTWVKEENYNSGAGSDFMGSTFSQSMTFFEDGTLADNGSTATISGNNYFGQSKSKETVKIPGLVWYTRANQLYLGMVQNGIQQEVHLGRFYVENGNMLITNSNGTKMLLHKK